jgi:hypothetical protein
VPTPVDQNTPAPEEQLTAEQAQALWAEELASRESGPAEAAPEIGEQQEPSQGDATPPAQSTTEPSQKAPWEDRLAALESANRQFATELGRANGRVSALQSKLDSGAAAARAVKDAPTQAQQDAAAEDPEEWKQLMEDFPEWGVAFKKKIDADIARITRSMETRAAEGAPAAQANVAEIVQQEVAKREFARVDRLHPGWRDTVKTPAFEAWFKIQSQDVQALAESDVSDDAISILDLFRESAPSRAGDIAARRSAVQNAAAVTGKPRQPAGVKAVDTADMTPQQLWEHELAQRKKKRAA